MNEKKQWYRYEKTVKMSGYVSTHRRVYEVLRETKCSVIILVDGKEKRCFKDKRLSYAHSTEREALYQAMMRTQKYIRILYSRIRQSEAFLHHLDILWKGRAENE